MRLFLKLHKRLIILLHDPKTDIRIVIFDLATISLDLCNGQIENTNNRIIYEENKDKLSEYNSKTNKFLPTK